MREFIKLTKWFYNESMSYMKGYSKWYIYSKMPKAYIKFMRRHITFKTKER